MAVVHDFRASLERAGRREHADWLGNAYRRAFPDLRAIVDVRQDGWAQRGGIDLVLTLESGRTIWIDEKIRERDWPDFLLEYWSDYERRVPGWVAQDLACDYIAYAFAPSRMCHLLPFQCLRRAWRRHGQEWIEKFGTRIADNGRYSTHSTPVPKSTLLFALSQAMTIKPEAV